MQCNYYFIIKLKHLRTLTCNTCVSASLFSLLLEGGKKALMVCLLGCTDMNTCWRGRLVEYSKCTDMNTTCNLLEG